jgi:hypothetical protein
MSDGTDDARLDIPPPSGSAPGSQPPWTLTAWNRKVIEGWTLVCRDIPENAARCYNWLREHPKQRIPGRCYELKHRQYAGVWCFEVGSGHRVYYKVREDRRDVLIYFAGRHPSKVPYPPKDA